MLQLTAKASIEVLEKRVKLAYGAPINGSSILLDMNEIFLKQQCVLRYNTPNQIHYQITHQPKAIAITHQTTGA
jgi:hypothetical protein